MVVCEHCRVKPNDNERRTSRLLRLPDVIDRVGLGKTSIYCLEREGDFPPRVQLSARAVAWREDAIDTWLASRPQAGRGATA